VAVVDRDADVPLSPLGVRQARALARWFAALPPDERPNVIATSPHERARRTASIIHEELGAVDMLTDERLRERELGAFDRLTRKGWSERFPEQAELRARLGKFYHRPPGGESWCDVILRLRTFMHDVQRRYAGARLLVVAHQVIVLGARYILEELDEAAILAIDARGNIANCAVTAYAGSLTDRSAEGRREEMRLVLENHVTPVEEAGEPVTTAPDEPVAPR